jgi:tetratricopeptide (TPR) repeat protein
LAESTAEARIRDLERRLDMDPGSRLFVSLAEEYRKLGRVREALSALQKGLLAHPSYVAAQVALGRAYLEANQTTDAIATFTKVLVADPGNLVASKSLADVYLSRGDNLEALKKYKLYRALSGDKKVDEAIAHLETLVAPRPVTPSKVVAPVEPPPPPPSFQETDKSQRRPLPRMPASDAEPLSDPFDVTSVAFEMGEDSGTEGIVEGPFLFPTRDVPLAPERPAGVSGSVSGPATPPPDLATRVIRIADALPAEAPAPAPPAESPEPVKPTGRALADLYYAQGHYAEALQIYDDLVTRHPFDDDLHRMRRDAEARLLPAGSTPEGTAADPGLGRRLARIRALKQWLSRVQAG